MSPNISNRTIHLPNDTPLKPPNKNFMADASGTPAPGLAPMPTKQESRFLRPQLPPTLRPSLNVRSKTTLVLPSSATSSSSISQSNPFKLRRTNSLISQGGSTSSSDLQHQSATTSSDRFIPSRYNSITGKLETTTNLPLPNASPQTHIKAQTSKIYQHHVAEACGLEVNSRILLYQPLPPERKKPVSLVRLLSSQSSVPKSKLLSKSSLTPSAASARANKIPSAPERVLDAPGLVDDFYLNLLAWSLSNFLAIGLEDAVYIWNASTGKVGLLCELPEKTLVTSLKWSQDGSYISIGKEDGMIEIWDIESNTKLRTLNCNNHLTRIALQDWNQHILTSGSRLGHIYHSDVRIANHLVSQLHDAHAAEVCGIEYRSDGQQLATGGNDNLVCIWDVRSTSNNSNNNNAPLYSKSSHKAAVKALSWCPYQSSLLATGGGSTDKTINFWNTATGARVNTIETGSQISSLNWGYANGTGMEIVATHGFPTNSISLFNYPTLQKTGEIVNAHDSRILNGCLSPDNLTLATVAGDENLKFWSLFDLYKNNKRDLDEKLGDGDESQDAKRIKKMMNLR
ncbi:APC/C activator protein CDC20 [Candida viswanathii]|uniref:APC/C activator protein CDC20 n=1 Tax=Candida viswanathii TaxID=5486 RepID=A0A367XXT2_9ASCO|nr:APC/C activator protein CDC20 [Candida viswanathii]